MKAWELPPAEYGLAWPDTLLAALVHRVHLDHDLCPPPWTLVAPLKTVWAWPMGPLGSATDSRRRACPAWLTRLNLLIPSEVLELDVHGRVLPEVGRHW